MEALHFLVDLALHLDEHLTALVAQYGVWVYAILFAVIFCETGLVVTPFLPGDSLLFVAGTVWAASGMDARVLAATLVAAALCGDNTNYWIGRFIGPRAFGFEHSRLFNRRALQRTHAFYERHGGKTIVLARFVPLVRTFAPFVAGVGSMRYPRFLAFCFAGAFLWVASLVSAGAFFGSITWVRAHLTAVILLIVALSLVPLLIEFVRARMRIARQ